MARITGSRAITRRRFLRAALAGAGAAASLPLLHGVAARAAQAAADAPKRGGTLRVGLYVDAVTMDPHYSGSKVDRQVYFNIYNTLVGLAANLDIVPELAESWETPDPTTYIFRLRKGVKFHDGTDFDAKAVKANFDRMMNPDNKSLRGGEVRSIDSVEVLDPAAVKLRLKQPDSALLATLTDRAGMMISPAAIQKYGQDLARNPVGTGPFSFVRWQKDDHILLRRNDAYWDRGKPYLDQVRYRVILDDSVKVNALKTGELDIIDYLQPKDVAGLKADASLTVVDVPSLAVWWFWLNTTKPPFDNRALREAVAYAIDIETIVKRLYLGVGVPANGPIPPSSWAYDRSAPFRARDLAKARAKLAEGGKPNGFKFVFESNNSPADLQVVQAVKAQVAEVGIDMDILPVDTGKQISDTVAKNYEATWAQWSGRPDPDGNTYNHFSRGGGMNYGGYDNPKVSDLLNRARAVSDRAQRKQIYSEIVRSLNQDVPCIFLWHPVEPKAMLKKVQAYPPIPDGMMRFAGVWMK
jgi:peptide/nickel transport system substrate-binding protein